MALTKLAWLSATLISLGAKAAAQPANLAAAQVELLVLRTSVPHRIPVRRDSMWLEPKHDLVSLDSAGRALTLLPKPAVCGGKPDERGLLRVSCRRLEDLSPYAIGGQLLIRYGEYGGISMGGLLRDVRKNHRSGVDTLRAMCMGRDTLIVPVVAMEIWQRDYYAPIFDTASAFPYNSWDSGDLDHDDPRRDVYQRYGVVKQFGFSASFDDTTGMSVSISGGASSPLAQSQVDEDEFQMSQLLAIVESLNLGADEAELRPALAKIAATFAQYWAGHGTMPQAAIAFINRYGQ